MLSTLKTPFKLKLFNFSHRHRSGKKTVHRGSMIGSIIPEDCVIKFHCGLAHSGTPSWFVNKGDYSPNAITFFMIVANDFNLTNEITFQMDNQLCSLGTYDVRNNNKISAVEQNGLLIDLRKLR